MKLKPLAYNVEMYGEIEKKNQAKKLINGYTNIEDYIEASVCYDAAAYITHLLDPNHITYSDIQQISGQYWLDKFHKEREWTGGFIEEGTFVGFYCLYRNRFFHAGIAVGDTTIRAINGFRLGGRMVLFDRFVHSSLYKK